jgi:hypothetical protein
MLVNFLFRLCTLNIYKNGKVLDVLNFRGSTIFLVKNKNLTEKVRRKRILLRWLFFFKFFVGFDSVVKK